MKKILLATMIGLASGIVPVSNNFSRGRAGETSPVAISANQSQPFTEIGHPTFMSPHASPIAINDGRVFVVNTPSDTVDVIDAQTRRIAHRISVGIDPVAIAVRPDGKEVWVANHVSDSVSVIDTDPESITYMQVVDTIQAFDTATQSTRFDEPVGIAFAGKEKAYVALSSENTIVVVDVGSRRVRKRLTISAQDPRAIVVRGDRLYVLPFESNNQTQLSGGVGEIDGELVTFDAHEHSVANNNVLSLGAVVDIVKHPQVPDRDLYVFDTRNDRLVETVDTLGTLLYGLAVDSKGCVYVAQTDARNDANGRAGTKKHGLAELANRAFLNQITAVRPNEVRSSTEQTSEDTKESDAAYTVEFIDLEPVPPEHPEPSRALATPFAIQITDDDSTLVVSAAGSDKLFTVDAASGEVLGRVDVEAVPRGIALESNTSTESLRAWVYNAVANSVSLVDVSDPTSPRVVDTIRLEDPTHPIVKQGRIAFNTASASTTGTFSCASCHPDGHTDQLLWVLATPVVTGSDQIMPRSTMPIRGLRDTAPFHWDGIPGDPYGGNNSANVYGHDAPNSTLDDPASSTRHLIDGGLANTMSMVGTEEVNDEGKPGRLSAAERDAMATFLLSVPYPPAQRRAYTNVISSKAKEGFQLFHIEGDHQGDPKPNVCGDCHRMPFWVSTNTPGTGMDAPTWRGAYDRWLILPQGRLNIIDFDFFKNIARRGIPERNLWQFSWAGRRRFDPVWDMVLEGSTGYSGAFARQVTLHKASVGDPLTVDLLDALELSDREGGVVLQGGGVFIEHGIAQPVSLQFDNERYVTESDDRRTYTRAELISLAADGRWIGTLTGRHGGNADVEHPQPALWTLGPIEKQSGRQRFPILYEEHSTMKLSGRHLQLGATLFVNGRRVSGTIHTGEEETVEVRLMALPDAGMHFLQVQNPNGLFSNDFIFHVVDSAPDARKLEARLQREHAGRKAGLGSAIALGDFEATRKMVSGGTALDARESEGGSTPLSTAALFGRKEIAAYLIEQGADVAATNRDGNTPLHVAAFLCRAEIVSLLLQNGAKVDTKNARGETPVDVVSALWSPSLAGFYSAIGAAVDLPLDLERMERDRPGMAKLLREYETKVK